MAFGLKTNHHRKFLKILHFPRVVRPSPGGTEKAVLVELYTSCGFNKKMQKLSMVSCLHLFLEK